MLFSHRSDTACVLVLSLAPLLGASTLAGDETPHTCLTPPTDNFAQRDYSALSRASSRLGRLRRLAVCRRRLHQRRVRGESFE